MEQAIQAAIKAFILEATPLNLCLAGVVGLLAWMLREERIARREDAKAVEGHMLRHSSALDRLSNVLTELRITVAGSRR